MNEDLEGALRHYLQLLEEEQYFEAHEVLEEAWHPLRLRKDPIANYVKGFINGAIAFEHIKRNRKNMQRKAQKVIASYERSKGMSLDSVPYPMLFAQAVQKIEALKRRHHEVFI